MDEKKQLWKGIAIGFAVTVIVIQAVMFGNKILTGAFGKGKPGPQIRGPR